jgi:hypothetical protein
MPTGQGVANNCTKPGSFQTKQPQAHGIFKEILNINDFITSVMSGTET